MKTAIMDEPYLVSVVMPAFNSEAYIAESIESVQRQTYSNWELIIIDDASEDETYEVVQDKKSEDSRIQLHRLPANQGTGFARNLGIKSARGRFISFLDADDLWKPEKLEVQLKEMLKKDLAVAFSSYELIDEEGKPLRKMVKAPKILTFEKLLKANYIGNLTGIYDAEKVGKIYGPLIRKRQDWGAWLLALQKSQFATGVQEPLAAYRVRKNSLSGNKLEMLKYNYLVYREVLGLSSRKSFLSMGSFLWEQLFVKSRRVKRLK